MTQAPSQSTQSMTTDVIPGRTSDDRYRGKRGDSCSTYNRSNDGTQALNDKEEMSVISVSTYATSCYLYHVFHSRVVVDIGCGAGRNLHRDRSTG